MNVTRDVASEIAMEFAKRIGLAPFTCDSVMPQGTPTDRAIEGPAEWHVYLTLVANAEFQDDPDFAIVVVDGSTGGARLLETL